MGLGILEDRVMEHVPGLFKLSDILTPMLTLIERDHAVL